MLLQLHWLRVVFEGSTVGNSAQVLEKMPKIKGREGIKVADDQRL